MHIYTDLTGFQSQGSPPPPASDVRYASSCGSPPFRFPASLLCRLWSCFYGSLLILLERGNCFGCVLFIWTKIGVWFARSASCLDLETTRSGQSAIILPSCEIEPQASLNSPGSDTLGDFLGPFGWHMPYFRCLLFSQSCFRWCSCLEQSKRTLSQNLTLFCGNFFVCDRDESKISSVREASCDLEEEFWKHSVRKKNIVRLFCVESVLWIKWINSGAN